MLVKTKDNGGLYVRSKPGGGRKRTKPPDEVRSYKIQLYLNRHEYDQLQQLAILNDCSATEYLRAMITKEYSKI